MARQVIIEAVYPGDPDAIFASALDFSELQDAMAGLAQYEGLPAEPVKQGQRIVIDVTLWGWMKNSGHEIYVETLNRVDRWLQSREKNAAIKRWDHHLSVQPHEKGALWRDAITVDAGWRSFLLGFFVGYVYRYRHKRRNALEITTRSTRAE